MTGRIEIRRYAVGDIAELLFSLWLAGRRDAGAGLTRK
jgi:hypothetical protein